MATQSLFWVDLRNKRSNPDLFSNLPTSYEAKRLTRPSEVIPRIKVETPWAVCFEYDSPRIADLQVVTDTKQHRYSTPIVMLTESSSPELSSWALRSCIWEHLVKPISVKSLCNCLMTIYRCCPSQESGKLQNSEPSISAAPESELSDDRFFQVIAYVAGNYMEKISLARVSRLCGLSPFQFSRAFKKAKGVTFRDFVIDFRIERAAKYLTVAGASVTDAAFGNGFNDLSYFARMFRRRYGISPAQYRESITPKQLPLFSAETLTSCVRARTRKIVLPTSQQNPS
jgi:AraC-like DNA-binding protein